MLLLDKKLFKSCLFRPVHKLIFKNILHKDSLKNKIHYKYISTACKKIHSIQKQPNFQVPRYFHECGNPEESTLTSSLCREQLEQVKKRIQN